MYMSFFETQIQLNLAFDLQSHYVILFKRQLLIHLFDRNLGKLHQLWIINRFFSFNLHICVIMIIYPSSTQCIQFWKSSFSNILSMSILSPWSWHIRLMIWLGLSFSTIFSKPLSYRSLYKTWNYSCMTFDYEEWPSLSMSDPTFHSEFAWLSPQKWMFPNKATIFYSCSSLTTICNFSKCFCNTSCLPFSSKTKNMFNTFKGKTCTLSPISL